MMRVRRPQWRYQQDETTPEIERRTVLKSLMCSIDRGIHDSNVSRLSHFFSNWSNFTTTEKVTSRVTSQLSEAMTIAKAVGADLHPLKFAERALDCTLPSPKPRTVDRNPVIEPGPWPKKRGVPVRFAKRDSKDRELPDVYNIDTSEIVDKVLIEIAEQRKKEIGRIGHTFGEGHHVETIENFLLRGKSLEFLKKYQKLEGELSAVSEEYYLRVLKGSIGNDDGADGTEENSDPPTPMSPSQLLEGIETELAKLSEEALRAKEDEERQMDVFGLALLSDAKQENERQMNDRRQQDKVTERLIPQQRPGHRGSRNSSSVEEGWKDRMVRRLDWLCYPIWSLCLNAEDEDEVASRKEREEQWRAEKLRVEKARTKLSNIRREIENTIERRRSILKSANNVFVGKPNNRVHFMGVGGEHGGERQEEKRERGREGEEEDRKDKEEGEDRKDKEEGEDRKDKEEGEDRKDKEEGEDRKDKEESDPGEVGSSDDSGGSVTP